jgi:hypothetical protein
MPKFLYRESLCNVDGFELLLSATNLDDAISEGETILRDANWIDRPLLATQLLHGYVVKVTKNGEEVYCIDAIVEPDEPSCIDSDGHDWQSPHYLVGGLPENPGVWGSYNGGVIVREVCLRCGCGRTIDTRAHDTDTGECFEETTYTPGEFSEYIEEEDD